MISRGLAKGIRRLMMSIEQELRRVPPESDGASFQGGPEAYVGAVIDTLTRLPDLDAVARSTVKVVTEATGCDACALYLLDEGRLSVRAAFPEGARIGSEGLDVTLEQPWSRGQLLVIPDPSFGASESPGRRGVHPRSTTSVPIWSRSGVVGALTAHARGVNAFSAADLEFLGIVAAVVGQAMENLGLEQVAATSQTLLRRLSQFTERVIGSRSAEEILTTVTSEVRALLGAIRCEVFLLDEHQRLVLSAADPSRPAGASIDARRLWVDLASERHRAVQRQGSRDDARTLAEMLWGADAEGTALFAPLRLRGASLGLLGALVAEPRPEEQRVLAAVAAITALALNERATVDRLHEGTAAAALFKALSGGAEAGDAVATSAAVLGIDLEATHVALHAISLPGCSVSPRPGHRLAASAALPCNDENLEQSLLGALPGALLERGPACIRGLVPVDVLTPHEVVTRVGSIQRALATSGDGWSIGLSSPAAGPQALHRALEEAGSAAEIGSLVHGGAGVYRPEALGAYRYLLCCREAVDERQHRLEALIRHDVKRNVRLFETLESWLDHKGNVVATARLLGIHQNTLRQRLARIEEFLDIELDREDWLSLAIASKIVKLRLLTSSAAANESEEGLRPVYSSPLSSRIAR